MLCSLNSFCNSQQAQWLAFNRELRQGKLTHLDYDRETQTLTWRRPKAEKDTARQDSFYEQLAFCDVADVFRFVNDECQFLSALTPLQPRYAKQVTDADSLMAVIIAQAMKHGNLVSQSFAVTGPFPTAETTCEIYSSISTRRPSITWIGST